MRGGDVALEECVDRAAADRMHHLLVRGKGHVEIVNRAAISQETPTKIVQPRLQHHLPEPSPMRIEPDPAVPRVDRVVRTTRR